MDLIFLRCLSALDFLYRCSHDRPVRALSQHDAQRIGAELKRWSQRPIRETNVRALGLCGVLMVLAVAAAQYTPQPAAGVRVLAAVYIVMLGSLHYLSMGWLRGLLRAGVAEARDALASVRDPRRISALDMAMLWVVVALLARHFE